MTRHDEPVLKLGMMMPRASWTNFRWDFSSALFVSIFNAVFGQFYIPMALRHGASNFQVGLLTAAPAIGLLFSPIWASLVANRSPKPFVLWPNLIARLSLIMVAFLPRPLTFVVISLFINFLGGIQAPAYAALVTRMYPPELRGRLMGYVRMALGFVLIPLAYVIGDWIHMAGDQGPLITAAIAGAISIVVFWNVREIEPAAAPQQQPEESPKERFFANVRDQWLLVKHHPALKLFLLATTLAGFGNLLANPLYQIFQVNILNLSSIQIGETRVAYYVFLLIAYFSMGWVIDRFSPRHAMYVGVGAYVVAPMLYALFGSYPAAMLASGCLGVGDATWDIGCMAFVFQATPGREAKVFGIHLMLFGIRGTAAPVLSTLFAKTLPLSWIFVTAAACSLAGMWAMFQAGRHPAQTQSAQALAR
ncbi:MAG: MFS transporter [Alicyclobacillus sp.]|nr:MFS transporter [Alicyclobacillus sp.]